MPSRAALPTVLPLYTRAPTEASRLRRIAIVAAQVAAAAVCGFLAVALPPNMLVALAAPSLVGLLFALWLMPDRGVFPLRAIQRSYIVLLVMQVVWPNYIAVVLPGLPWLTPTRVALFLVTFLFLYSVSTSAALRHHLGIVARSLPALWVALLIWQVTMVVSMPFSHALGSTIKMYFDDQLRLTEMFFLGCLLFSYRGAPTRTIAWLIALAVVCAVDGFVELRLGYPPWAYHIPSFMRVDDAIMETVLGSQARSADGLYRVHGPFPLSLVYAEYLAMCTPFILHWIVTGRSIMLRLAMVFALVLVFAGIVISQSRLGLVGVMVGFGMYLPLWAFRRWRADRSSLLGPAVVLGVPFAAILVLGIIFSSHTLTTRLLGGGAQQASNESRAEQRRLAVPKVVANPIGHGLGQSGDVLGFANQAGKVSVDNHFITSVLDIGVAGVVSFYTMFVVAAYRGIRLYLSTKEREVELAGPLAVMFVIFIFIKSVLSQENNHPIVLLALGMLVALSARERRLVDPDNLFPRADRV